MHGENIFLYIQKLSLTAREFITSNISCHKGWQILLKHLLMRPLFLYSLPNSIIATDKKHLKILSAKVSKYFSFSLPSADFTPNGKGQKICTAENKLKMYKVFEKVRFINFQLIN